MPRITYQDFQNSRIPAAVGECPASMKLLAWLQEAEERLLYEGKWWGTYSRVRICATDGCITLPSQLATIEAIAQCGRPLEIRDSWYEFLEKGMGIRGECSCWPEAIMRGNYPVFRDISSNINKLLFVCDVTLDVGKQVLALGYDENNNWIRTLVNGAWQDGEIITLAQSPGTQSVNIFTSITDLQFPSNMEGQTWLYSYSTVDASQIMLGHYQYNETRPSYARYFMPSVQSAIRAGGGGCGNGVSNTTGCKTVQLEMVCKHALVPVTVATDYLNIPCLPALKEMITALKNSENEGDGNKANGLIATGLQLAKAILDKQLNHFLGDGVITGITIQGSGGAGYDCAPEVFI